ncbi:MAG: sulfatase-like hydrolase/transferase [Phycisphaerales bacterium]
MLHSIRKQPGTRHFSLAARLFIVAFALLMTFAQVALAADERPNIIVFLSDDHRADVLGCAGHAIVKTPNIDGLAADGVRFSSAFVTTSICAASRATILTGVVERTHRFTFGTQPIAKRFCEASYPYRLKSHGYRTGFVGKFGVAVSGGETMIDQMFDSFVPLARTPYVKTLPDGSKRHVTDLTGDKAIEFIRATPKGTPFCLSVSFNAGHAEDADKVDHYPYPESEAALYRNIEMRRPKLDSGESFDTLPEFLKDSLNRQRYFWRWDTPEKYDHNLRNYFRMISGLDRNIGRVLDELRAQGLANDTIIMFMGDNGYYMGERGLAGKWSHYEQSLRVPLVIFDPRQPAAIRGRVVDSLVLNLDITPTVLDVAGVEWDESYQGRSLLPFIQRPNVQNPREGFYCEHRMKHAHIPRWEGYRTGRYMYARYLDVAESNEFFHDLNVDPDQLTNLAGDSAYKPVLTELRRVCTQQSDLYAAAGEPLPRVLMLGDSISMGYHRFVVESLLDEAEVVRPRENCVGTTNGIRKIDQWLQTDGGGFDVIHFNFGLHDLVRVKTAGSNAISNDPSDPRQADQATYEHNLRLIVASLKATGATLIFATTTPFPSGVRPHRDPEDAARYNAVARKIMEENGIAIDDLYEFAVPRLEAIQQPAKVHFKPEGSKQLAGEVSRHIRAAVRRR